MAPTSPQTNQQREFVRIDDTLPLAWKRVDSTQFAEVMSYFEKHRTFPKKINEINQLLDNLDVTEKLRQLDQTDPQLARILGRLDQKLNILLRLFHPGEAERPMVLTSINISGGGISFMDRNPEVTKGDILALRLALTTDSLIVIECYARVMMLTEKASMTQVACRFEPILDQDREQLIQYLFKRQSELLRAKRGF